MGGCAYHPTSFSELCLIDNRFLDLEVHLLDMRCVDITTRVEVRNCLEAFLHETILGQPSWSLGEKERHDDQDEGENDLDDKGALPRYVIWEHEVKPVVNPAGQHVSGDETCVLNSNHQASSMGRRDFSLDNRNDHGQKAHTEALESSSDDEGREVGSEDLDESREEVDDTT